ncbi:hypothetical protein [Pedobacter sp. WC2423]|uniref:hypothetical protein n=1 Tax=Pedobacter sp. WC2423 TaxID=3234142 RepID=UPI0034671AD0
MKRYLILIALPFLLLSTCSVAQTFQHDSLFSFWKDAAVTHPQILKKNGFKKVYGGPKKAGGFLYLYHNKTAQEYLFIHYTQEMATKTISYLVPAKAAYQKLTGVDQKTFLKGEKIISSGTTRYEDGKKYYQVTYLCESCI